MAMLSDPALIALDWGTTSLRAWQIATNGIVLDRRHTGWGIMSLPHGGFPEAFAAITREWEHRAQPLPVIACGMVGSRQGWRETPYLSTPATSRHLAANLIQIATGNSGQALYLVPGLMDKTESALDLMRGEESQAIGALQEMSEGGLLVMPGTHCKWAWLRDGAVTSFKTMMTGELFALLSKHSILRSNVKPPAAQEPRDAAFIRGVKAAFAHGALAKLFSTRTLALSGELPAGSEADYLSGLLIGEELRVFEPNLAKANHVALTGEESLCTRYQHAFAALGIGKPTVLPDTALAGLLRIAKDAGISPMRFSDGAA